MLVCVCGCVSVGNGNGAGWTWSGVLQTAINHFFAEQFPLNLIRPTPRDKKKKTKKKQQMHCLKLNWNAQRCDEYCSNQLRLRNGNI